MTITLFSFETAETGLIGCSYLLYLIWGLLFGNCWGTLLFGRGLNPCLTTDTSKGIVLLFGYKWTDTCFLTTCDPGFLKTEGFSTTCFWKSVLLKEKADPSIC